MPKIAEILGPSGVGKSYLYNNLQKVWKENYTWVPYHDFRHNRIYKKKTLPEMVRNYATKILTGLERIDYLNADDENLTNQKHFNSHNSDFVSLALNIINDCCKDSPSKTDKRFDSILYFLRTSEQYQSVIKKKEDDRLCVLYEGFLNRIMHLNFGTFNDKYLKKYVDAMPTPNGVVYLKATPDYVLQNIKKRARVASVHIGMSDDIIYSYTEKTQKYMESAVFQLKESGVNVKIVDAERNTKNETSNVIDFLNSIS